MLAGVSLTWYTWLEQGRRINASNDVLLAIGRALRLDDAGLEHLLSLTEPGTATIAAPAEAPSAVVRLLDVLMPAPAYVLGPIWEFVGWNTAQARLYPRIIELEPPRRNLMWVLFADPSTRRTDRRLGHPRPSGLGRVPVGNLGGAPRPGDGRTRRRCCATRATSSPTGGASTTCPASRPGCDGSVTPLPAS